MRLVLDNAAARLSVETHGQVPGLMSGVEP
jgi:hypothetical protein